MSDQDLDNVTEMRCKHDEPLNVYNCDFFTHEGTLGEKIVSVKNITEFEELDNIWIVNFTQVGGLIFYFEKERMFKDGSGTRPTRCSVWRTINRNTKKPEVVVGCSKFYGKIPDGKKKKVLL